MVCPKCGKQIDGANINVAQDMAFCAPCGEMHKISALTAAATSVQTAAPQAKTQFCTKCGAQLNNGIKFCAGCGSPVTAAQAFPVHQQTAAYQQAVPSRGGTQRFTILLVASILGIAFPLVVVLIVRFINQTLYF